MCQLLLSIPGKSLELTDLVSIQPDDKSPVPLKTKCIVTYDSENIYFNWEAEIGPDFSKNKKGRNDVFQDSDFLRAQIVTLPGDSFCYVFYCYPDGSYIDAIRDQNFNLSELWDSHFTAENSFSENTWYCKMTIPFKDLRYTKHPPYQWNVSVCRQFFNSNTLYSDPFLSISLMGRDYFKNGHPITIDQELPKHKNLQVIPYYTPVFDWENDKEKTSFKQFGLDCNYKPMSLINLKLSMNPDFSDVPMDMAQNNFNSKYQPYYNENRYFFTEDLNAFDIDTDYFYTRNILQPQIAGKLTGTNDRLNYGFLYCLDQNPDEFSDKYSRYSVFSIKPKFSQAEVGISALYYENDDVENLLFIGSPVYFFKGNSSVLWKNAISIVKDSLGQREGIDSYLSVNYRWDKWSLYIKNGFYSKDFTALMGRIYDPSIIYNECNLSYSSNNNEYFEDFELSIWSEPTWTTKPEELMKWNTGVYLKTDPKGNLYKDFNFSYHLIREDSTLFQLPQMRNYISYSFRKLNFSMGSMYSAGWDYHYDLKKKVIYAYIEPNINYQANQFLNFNISSCIYSYPNLKTADKEICDDFYYYINAEMKNIITDHFFVSSGLFYTQYFTGDYGFYTNLIFEVNKDVSFYAGFSQSAYRENHQWINNFSNSYYKYRFGINF